MVNKVEKMQVTFHEKGLRAKRDLVFCGYGTNEQVSESQKLIQMLAPYFPNIEVKINRSITNKKVSLTKYTMPSWDEMFKQITPM